MQNVVTRDLLHLCLSILCLALSAFLVIFALNLRRVSDSAVGYFDNARNIQTSLNRDAQKYGEVISECALYAATIPLEESRILSAYEAARIRDEALIAIKGNSPKWGKIAQAADSAMNKQREEREARQRQMPSGVMPPR